MGGTTRPDSSRMRKSSSRYSVPSRDRFTTRWHTRKKRSSSAERVMREPSSSALAAKRPPRRPRDTPEPGFDRCPWPRSTPCPPPRARSPGRGSASDGRDANARSQRENLPLPRKAERADGREHCAATRWACSRSQPSSRTPNSSPPNRARLSPRRIFASSNWASWRSSESPAACPHVSLTTLNWSRSI
jgi:hypothetical protein